MQSPQNPVMRSSHVLRKALLWPLAAGLTALLIQACAEHEMAGGSNDWASATAEKIKGNGNTDSSKLGAYLASLNTCKATGWETTFSSPTTGCLVIRSGQSSPTPCSSGPSPSSIHVAQHVYFNRKTDHDCFVAAMGFPLSGK